MNKRKLSNQSGDVMNTSIYKIQKQLLGGIVHNKCS